MESSVFDSGPKKLLKALGRLVGADQPPDAATLAEMSGAFGMIPMGGRLANRSLQQLRFNAPGELLERITDMLKGGRIQGFHGTRLDPNLAQGALVPKRRDLHIGTIDAALDRIHNLGGGPSSVYPVDIDIGRRIAGTPERPVSDTAANKFVDLFDRIARTPEESARLIRGQPLATTLSGTGGDPIDVGRLMQDFKRDPFTGILYRNKFEDPGSLSFLSLDPTRGSTRIGSPLSGSNLAAERLRSPSSSFTRIRR